MAEKPACLHVQSASPWITIQRDLLTAVYRGKGNRRNDFGSVRSAHPVPASSPWYYFEIKVVDAGDQDSVTIGLAPENFDMNLQPGTCSGSFGYCGEDGQAYPCDESDANPYGPRFTSGDVVGCGIHHARQEVFFTKNGRSLGAAYVGVSGELYPIVGLHSTGAVVEFVFREDAFSFPTEYIAREYQRHIDQAVEGTQFQPTATQMLIHDYLLHCGYGGTLDRYKSATGMSSVAPASDVLHSTLDVRQRCRALILQGSIPEALVLLNEEVPHLLSRSPRADFLLRCQQFIEIVRSGDVNGALSYAHEELGRFRSQFLPESSSTSLANVPVMPPISPISSMDVASSATSSCDEVSSSSSSSSDDDDDDDDDDGDDGTASHDDGVAEEDIGDVTDQGAMGDEDEAGVAITVAQLRSRGARRAVDANGGTFRRRCRQRTTHGTADASDKVDAHHEDDDEDMPQATSDPCIFTDVPSKLEHVMGLLAYSNPTESPLAFLLSQRHRDAVAEEVNAAVVGDQGPSDLETSLMWLIRMKKRARKQRGGTGEVFSIMSSYV